MKTLLIIIYSIVAIVLTILTLIQSKDDEGASGTITGASSSFYEKNKGRTKEGQLKKNYNYTWCAIYSTSNCSRNSILVYAVNHNNSIGKYKCN